MSPAAQVTTYDVIPVSQSVGVMEFVPDTEQLLTVISPGVIPAEDMDVARKAYSSCGRHHSFPKHSA